MKRYIKKPYFIVVFLVLAGVMITSALIEFNQSRKELYSLMTENAEATLAAIARAGDINLKSDQLFEAELTNRLLSSGLLINRMAVKNNLDNSQLEEIAQTNRLNQIVILNRKTRVLVSSNAAPILPDIDSWDDFLTNKKQEIILGFHSGDIGPTGLYSVAVKAGNGNIVLLSIDSSEIIQFRKTIGFGRLISEVAGHENFVYMALQDTTSIIAATQNLENLNPVLSDPFLVKAIQADSTFAREFTWNGEQVYEVVRPFYYDNEIVGLYRLGLSLDGIRALNQRTLLRIFIITGVLIVVGILLFILLTIRQQYEIINRQYSVVHTYYGNILQNIADGVISFTDNNKISMINKAAREILSLNGKDYIDKDIAVLPKEIFPKNGRTSRTLEITLGDKSRQKTLAIDSSVIKEHDGRVSTTIFVLKDLTEQRKLEEQVRQRERLSSLGRMAAGVAHEIRNPLNAISTIVQQFDLDFKPKSNEKEYYALTKLLNNEIRRLNGIVTQFVEFSRPGKLRLSWCKVNELLNDTIELVMREAAQKSVLVKSQFPHLGIACWDANQVKQCILNLTNNAIQAVACRGQVEITAEACPETIKINIMDNGPGIPAEDLSKIYDLYYTTKVTGAGLGLSIVHRIVSEHKGTITVKSTPGAGTKFTIELPKNVEEI